jgi:hypothetical protein
VNDLGRYSGEESGPRANPLPSLLIHAAPVPGGIALYSGVAVVELPDIPPSPVRVPAGRVALCQRWHGAVMLPAGTGRVGGSCRLDERSYGVRTLRTPDPTP